MDKELAVKLVEVLSDVAKTELYEDYAGRGMYGKTTTAVVFNGSLASVLSSVICMADEFCIDEEMEGLPEAKFCPTLRTDSMGRDIIIY
jgi:hypothetical protein